MLRNEVSYLQRASTTNNDLHNTEITASLESSVQLARRTTIPAHGHFGVSVPDQHKWRPLINFTAHIPSCCRDQNQSHKNSTSFMQSSSLCLQQPATESVLRQMNPVHNSITYFSRIHIIFPPTRRSSKWPLPFRFYEYIFLSIYRIPYARYMPHRSQPFWFNHANDIWWCVRIACMMFLAT
jgi:hypothetical protein